MTRRRPGRRLWLVILSEPMALPYHGRHDDSQLFFGLFEVAKSALSEAEPRTELDENWFWQVAGRYKVGLAPQPGRSISL